MKDDETSPTQSQVATSNSGATHLDLFKMGRSIGRLIESKFVRMRFENKVEGKLQEYSGEWNGRLSRYFGRFVAAEVD